MDIKIKKDKNIIMFKEIVESDNEEFIHKVIKNDLVFETNDKMIKWIENIVKDEKSKYDIMINRFKQLDKYKWNETLKDSLKDLKQVSKTNKKVEEFISLFEEHTILKERIEPSKKRIEQYELLLK